MSTLEKYNFDNLSDDLFSSDDDDDKKGNRSIAYIDDDEEDTKKTEIDTTSQETEEDYGTQRLKEKKRLYEIYMADPAIPENEKNVQAFMKTLYNPTYRTQKLYAIKKKLDAQKQLNQPVVKKKKLKKKKKPVIIEGFGYDNTFFAPKEELIAEQQKIANIPEPIKEIYKEKGIVTASQLYNIEKSLECHDDDNGLEQQGPSTSKHQSTVRQPKNNKIGPSLLELSRTLSELQEIEQVKKDLENLDDLDTSLTELSEKLQYSQKAKVLIDHTITTSQRLKILDELNTFNFEINTCDVLCDYDDETYRNTQKNAVTTHVIDENLPIENGKSSDINHNIHDSVEINQVIPTEVKFSFASGKNVAISNATVNKFKNIFENEEKKSPNIDSTVQKSMLTSLNVEKKTEPMKVLHENGQASGMANFGGFTFASGKKLNVNNSKVQAFEKKFKDEEEKLRKMEPKINLCSQPENDENKKPAANDSCTQTSQPDEEGNLASQRKSARIQLRNTPEVTSQSPKLKGGLKRIRSKTLFGRKPKKVHFNESIMTSANEDLEQSSRGITSVSGNNFAGFAFANGKSANVDASKYQAIERKFMEEEEKMMKMEVPVTSSKPVKVKSIEKTPPKSTKYFESQFVFDDVTLGEIEKIEKAFLDNSSSKNENKEHLQPSTSKSIRENPQSSPRKAINTSPSKFLELNQSEAATSNNTRFKSRGFIFASGKNACLNQSKIDNFKKKFEEEDKDKSFTEMHEKSPSTNQSSLNINQDSSKAGNAPCGFVFASGKNACLNQSKIDNFKKKFEEVDKDKSFKDVHENSPSSNRSSLKIDRDFGKVGNAPCGFVFASGKNACLNQSKIDNFKKKFEEVDKDKSFTEVHEKSPSSNQSSLKIDRDSGLGVHSHRINSLRAKKMQEEEESDLFNFGKTSLRASKRGDSGIDSQNKVESPRLPFPKSFFAPSFTSSPVVQQLKVSKKLIQHESPISPVATFKRKLHIGTSQFVDDDDDFIPFKRVMVNKTASKNDLMISPIVASKSKKSKVRKVSEALPKNQKWTYIHSHMAEIDEWMHEQSQLRLFEDDPTESQVQSILVVEQQAASHFEAQSQAKMQRKGMLKQQMDYAAEKPEEDARRMTGTMFMMKSGSNRKTLKDYVGDEKPLDKNIHAITMDDILNYEFDMKLFVDGDVSLKVSITAGDNAEIVMTDTSQIGFNEIKHGFLASYGVDPKLIKEGWIENAYQMIFMKFLWMENSFDKIDKFEVLNPENLLLQLKYRYDREIDRHQRPALRKILELDESPCRRMVLKVIDVIYTLDTGYELELSDGWYKIRTIVDCCLAEAIAKKKIVANTKLMICNAELLNIFTSGYHPLDIPNGVKLKIHGNSTREVAWDKKLGFCKNSVPYLISMNSMSNDGGVVGKLRLYIIHVYSMIYVESIGEKKEFRSEKMQNRIENKKEILYSTMYEKIEKQVMEEAYKDLKERVAKIDRKKFNLSRASLHEISDILEYESESTLAYAIKSQLSWREVEKIQDIHNQQKYELHQKIKERISKSENNVAQLLKFRVMDLQKPDKTALVSWWRPSEELLSIVKVGNSIELLKISSAGKFQATYGGEAQIHADSSTVVKLLKSSSTVDEKFKNYIRRETKFEEVTQCFRPLNNEFDIVCMIIHVAEKENKERFQKVYVSDERMNFISLNFYPTLTEYAYDDVLIEGKVMFIRNVQWRKSINGPVPEAFAVIDSTIFISNPREDEHKERLNEFMRRVDPVAEYLKKCREKLQQTVETLCMVPKKLNIMEIPTTFHDLSPFVKDKPKKGSLGMRKAPIYRYKFS